MWDGKRPNVTAALRGWKARLRRVGPFVHGVTLMSTLVAGARSSSLLDAVRPLLMSRWLWCLLGAVFVALRDMGSGQVLPWVTLGDTDDATRLVQVREFLAGASWYDVLLPRFGGPQPLLSHWSRLIDVPIAMLISTFGVFVSVAQAEMAARIVWPMLLLMVFLRVLVHEAEVRGGVPAALAVIAFAVTTLSGLFQFRPGRIDHHNAMIIGTVGGFLVLARSLDVAKAGWFAGFAMGTALVVGYEPLMVIVPMMALAALAATIHTDFLESVRNVAIAMATTLGVGLLITSPPTLWHVVACDALAINLVLLVFAGAIGLSVLHAKGRAWPLVARLGFMTASGAAGVGLYVASNPICLRGPFAMTSQEALDVWLINVWEATNIFEMVPINPTSVFAFCVFGAIGVASAIWRYRRLRTLEAAALAIVMTVTFLVAIAPSIGAVKFMPYASFLAAFCAALLVADFKGNANLTPLSAKLIGAIALNQSAVAMYVGGALMLGGTSKDVIDGTALRESDVCRTIAAIVPLAKLPKGFIVASVDFGPHIVALTRHDVLAAPYHRIDQSIVDSYRVFRSKPAESEAILRRLDADYVVECIAPLKSGETPQLERDVARDSLLGKLVYGESVPFLEELKGASPEPAVRVWRVKRIDE